MRNIFLFIRLYFNLIFFLLLQGISVYLIVHYSKYHQAAFGSVSNRLTGKVNKEYSRVNYYFHLKKTNDSLVKANEMLYNKLRVDFQLPDTVTKTFIDSIRVDSILQFRKYTYHSARVVSNSIATQNNYLVLSAAGNANKLHAGMGVVDVNNAVIGIITESNGEFSTVMSLLHKDSKVNGKLLKSGETGTVIWDGRQPGIITLTSIPKSAKVAKGDTVITSGYSTHFPKGLMIGTVSEIFAEKSTSNFLIKLKTAANFYDLQYVYAIDNAQQEPIDKILDKLKVDH